MKRTSLYLKLLAAVALTALATAASATPVLNVDFGTPDSPVAPGFTLVSATPTGIGAYTVSFSGHEDMFNMGAGTPPNDIIGDFMYNNTAGTAITIEISGLNPGTYNLTVWSYQGLGTVMNTVVSPGVDTSGTPLIIFNDGSDTLSDTSPEVRANGTFTITGSTMQLLVTDPVAVLWGPRINGFILDSSSVGPTTTVLERTAGADPCNPGDSLTFTATVSGTAPAEDVKFYDGTTLLGTQPLTLVGESYLASLTTSALAIGTHSITATYVGDLANAPSTSLPVSQTIRDTRPESSIALSLSAGSNPSDLDAAVSFKATVTGSNPTGNVEFYDGATLLGTVTLNGSFQAGLTTSTLGLGTHSITAKYVGDSGNKPSSSAALSHTVTGPAMLFGRPGPAGNTRTDGSLVAGTAFNANARGAAQVNHVGFWDEGGDGLEIPHVVGLFERDPDNPNYNWRLLARATVPAGTEAPLIGGYRWAELPAAITLTDTTEDPVHGRYALLAEVGTDPWYGWSATTSYSFVDASFAASVGQRGSFWQFDVIGEVGTSHAFIDNSYIFGAGNMGFFATLPQPTLQLECTNPWVPGASKVTIRWNSQPGWKYQLQYKNALSDAEWTDCQGPQDGTGSEISVEDQPAPDTQRFYQVKVSQ